MFFVVNRKIEQKGVTKGFELNPGDIEGGSNAKEDLCYPSQVQREVFKVLKEDSRHPKAKK